MSGYGLHIVQVSQNGESHLMIFEDTTMCNFNGSFEWLAFLSFEEFTMNGTALILDILIAIEWVGDHVTDNLNGFGNVAVERGHHVAGVLAGGVGVEVAAHVLDFKLELVAGSVFGALEMQVLQKVSRAARCLALVPASALYEHRNTI